MKLAKVRLADGKVRVALVEDKGLQLLDMEQVTGIRVLSDILHAPDPVGLAKFLVDPMQSPEPSVEPLVRCRPALKVSIRRCPFHNIV